MQIFQNHGKGQGIQDGIKTVTKESNCIINVQYNFIQQNGKKVVLGLSNFEN